MKNIQIILVFMGLALVANHTLAAASAKRCVDPRKFTWTSQQFDGEDFGFWTGVAGKFMIKARSKAQPKLHRARTASTKVQAGVHTCMYDAETADGQKFTAKAVATSSK